jgi:hypothetical protein
MIATAISWSALIGFLAGVIDGQPYTFYPVYGAGGVSLYYYYYIGKASDRSATVAVVTHRL